MNHTVNERHDQKRIGYQQLIKEQNIKRVFDLVREGHCASRAELVRTMKLSATTISTLVEELQNEGLIVEIGPTLTSMPGRRPMKLCMNYESRQLASFTLSRRGVKFTLYDLGCNQIESFFVEHTASAEAQSDSGEVYAKLFEDILKTQSKRIEPDKLIVVGVCFPGIYQPDIQAFSGETAMNTLISERPLRDLEEKLGIRLYIENASSCLAYAEKKHIDASNKDEETQNLIFINICDGVGAGIIANGAIVTGPYNTAGECGHISINPNGPVCECGNRGCLEKYVNQNALLARVQAACTVAGVVSPTCFAELEGIYERESAARRVLDEAAEELAMGVYSMICVSGIQRVAIGGGAEILGEGFLQKLRESVGRRKLLTNHVNISYGSTGEDGSSLGLVKYYLDKTYSLTLKDE